MRRDSGNGNANNRQASFGAIWNVGGAAASAGSPVALVTDGRGGLFGRGTSAPVYISRFLETNSPNEDMEKHESRLALALDVDQASTILGLGGFNDSPLTPVSRRNSRLNTDFENNKRSPVIWQDSEWVNVNSPRILDAPQLRDDFYCSLLAYSPTLHNLAVGLSSGVYLWSEKGGVQALIAPRTGNSHITSLAFSSEQGGLSILAIGRANGTLTLWSLYGPEPRFESLHAAPIACLAWKPRLTVRASARPIADGALTSTEELLVGDEAGTVYYYAVEWSSETQRVRDLWMGAMTLLARITVHTQQICGLAWSADGDFFATGGNDNACCMFETKSLVQAAQMDASSPVHSHDFNDPMNDYRGIFEFKPPPTAPPSPTYPRDVTNGQEKHRWEHRAAVKAIAFCPWQRGLVATGGGSNDRCIHFFHTISGACLATIFVGAQVTSLLWSTTRREIAATFGYAQPDHPYRIAVFSWPDCAQVLAVPWEGDLRALHAIAYPGGPNDANLSKRQGEGGPWASRTAEEGCIVVAASDQSVKFHEVWSECRKGTGGTKGLLGGSDILESLEGIDREGDDVIR
ncbi:MAG: hypothetical protein M1833_006738 [Piccolia ochrophora]|nr:MAG: hypothetical protein M1833_006738 [Piccolia ochrophora]